MIRATTGGVLKSYRANLMNSFISMNKARDTVLTQRNFNSYAEDPAAASKAFKLRKSRMTVESQHEICDDTYKKFQTGFSCLDSVSKLLDTKNGEPMTTLKGTTLELLDDPKGDARTQLNKVLDQLSQTIVQTMNQKYGENFIFAGADGHNVPFEIKDNKLYYRGVSVDAAMPKVMEDGGTPIQLEDGSYLAADASTIRVREFVEDPPASGTPLTVTKEDGTATNVLAGATALDQTAYDALGDADKAEYVKVDNNGATEYYKACDLASKADYDAEVAASAIKTQDGTAYQTISIDGQDYYVVNDPDSVISEQDYEAQKLEAEKLQYLVNEKYFVDIGLGFQENDNGQLIEASGFNAALNGLTFLGYGTDQDGDPKNIYSLVQEINTLVQSVPEGGSFANVWDDIDRLVGKLETAASDFKTEYANMDAGTTKLKNNLALLEDNFYNLQEQYAALEDADMVDSITSFIWAQYCYNAALKVGNNVLSESLMDYLN